MMRPATSLRALAAALLALLASSCGDSRAPEKETPAPKPIDTTLKENLPAGRFQLPTRHTPAPDFFISLPPGYEIKNRSRLPNDELYIISSDDPSLSDSTAITPGFMRVYVGVKPQSGFDRKLPHTEKNVMIGRSLLTWKLWSDTLPDGKPYHMREISSSDFYASISPELARAPLNLNIYIAGHDSTQVAELMRAAESLAMAP